MIFNKIFRGFIIILVLSFTVIGVTLFPLLGRYVISEKEEAMTQAGKRISEMTTELVLKGDREYENLYKMSIDVIARNMGTGIILADKKGNILIKTDIPISEISKDILKDVNNGKSVGRTGQFIDYQNTVFTVGVPVYYNGEVIGGVYLITNVPEIQKIRLDILKMYIITVLTVLLIAMIVVYFVSKNITQPINAITKASKELSNGKFSTRVKVYKDDETGQLATAFNNMADSIEKLEDMRRIFVSDVSHELRTPMTTITGFVEGVLDGTIPEEKRDIYLKIVLDETKRLSRLVNDLLDISKLSSDEVKLDLSTFNINEMIRLTVIQFEKRLLEKKISVNVVFENEKEDVIAEKDSIRRVLTNLMDNAVKFCNEKGKIDITVKRKGDKTEISIRNEGEGILDEEKKAIFERFYKMDKSRSKNKNGVGLGLYIVKSIMDKHKEKIWINSEQGKYAEFVFSLNNKQ